MRQAKQITRWLWTWLLVLAVVLPAVPQPVAQAAYAPAAAPSLLGGSPTGGEWLTGLTAPARGAVLERLDAWMTDWSASRVQRPPVDPIAQQRVTADWTVLIYIAADNNLEIQGLFDMNEMEAVGSSEDVNVVVQIDRSAEWTTIEGDWTGARRYYVQQDDDLEVLVSPMLEDLGEINSGDPDVVADFATWGITTYPAEKYMLIMWDHGGAWLGHSSDDEYGDDLDLPELDGVLSSVIEETGIDKFELVAFDMCLMGQLEVFQTIAPYANYALASEENIPGPGYFYVFLDELVQNPAMDGAALSQHVIDYYMMFYDEIWNTPDNLYGLSAVDLSQLAPLNTALNAFATSVQANPEAALSAIADARNNTLAYGGNDDPQYFDIWSSVDLYQFAELLAGISNAPELQQAAQDVMRSIEGFVIHEAHNDRLDGSHGVSIFFPRTIKAYQRAGFNERYSVEVPASMAPWVAFLDTFHGTAVEVVTTAPAVTVVNVYPETASIYQPAVIALDISGRDILQVNYAVARVDGDATRVVLDFDYLVSRSTTPTGADIVDWANGVTTRTFAWEAEVPQLTDGTTTTYALLIPNRDNPDLAVANGEYTAVEGGTPVEAQLVFNLNTGEASALWVFTQTASGTVQPAEMQPQPGDTFRPLLLTLDANNQLSGSSFGDTLTFSADPIRFEKVPAPSGQYSISFVAENVAGETTLDEALITVNNEGLDPALRGYTDLTYGVNFLYPATWIRPRFSPDGKRLFTADLETNTLLSLYPYTDVSTAQETADAVKASWGNLQDLTVSNEREVDVNGLPAYVLDYTYTFNDQPRLGAVIAIYVPEQNVGYGFDIDGPADRPDVAREALSALVGSINFFASQDAIGQSAWQTVSAVDGGVSFPVPTGWVQETTGEWTLYGPADDPSVFIGIASAPASGMTNAELAQGWVDQLQAATTDFALAANEPYYIGETEWHLVVFTYDDAGMRMAGAFFAASVNGQDYTFWLEAPDVSFDQLYADVFSVSLGGLRFNDAAPTPAPTETPTAEPTEVVTEVPTPAPTMGITAVPTETATETATEVATEEPAGGIGSLLD